MWPRFLTHPASAAIEEEVALFLLSALQAMEYYPKAGFEKIENGFIIKRAR